MLRITSSAPLALVFAVSCGAADSDKDLSRSQSPPATPSQEVPAVDATSSAEAGGPVVVFLGDSLMAGFSLPVDRALPEQVEARFAESGIAAEIINSAQSGETTASGLARFDFSVTALKPDIVVIGLGANDFLNGGDAATAHDNLNAIIDEVLAVPAKPVLVGLELRGATRDGSREAEFASIYPEIATERSIDLFPALLIGVRDDPALLMSDGLHPNADGIEQISERLAGFLSPIVLAVDE